MAAGLSSATARCTCAASSRSIACHLTCEGEKDDAIGEVPPGRCHATISPSSRSIRWLPTKPAAPVMSVGPCICRLARHAAHRAVERREVAKAGEGERQEEAVVGGDTERLDAAVVDGLIVECDAAALRIVEPGNPLLKHPPLRDVVAE